MKGKKLLNAIGQVDEKFIEEAAPDIMKNSHKIHWLRWTAAAACVMIAGTAAAFTFINKPLKQKVANLLTTTEFNHDDNKDAASETSDNDFESDKLFNGVIIPDFDVNSYANENKKSNLKDCIFYDENFYTQSPFYSLNKNSAKSLRGEYLGSSSGKIEQYFDSYEDGFPSIGGSVEGDIYSVNGYDTDFMLMLGDKLFINQNGIILEKGSDWFENRLKLSGNIAKVTNKKTGAEISQELTEQIINAVDEGTFKYKDQIEYEIEISENYEGSVEELTIEKKDGVKFDILFTDWKYVEIENLQNCGIAINNRTFIK